MSHVSEPVAATVPASRLKPPVLLAASITPLRDDGARVDEDAIGPLWEFQRANGVDGVFCCGTTGEGLLLSASERLCVTQRFREACDGPVISNVGSQSTALTCELAARVSELGVDGVAAVPPPYYPLGATELVEYMVAAARACQPVPFYLYVFTTRSGYPFPPAAVERIRDRVPNLAGLKVSEPSIEAVAPYIATGLDVVVGSEALIPEAMSRGAIGAASGMASAFPGLIADVVHGRVEDGEAAMSKLRQSLDARGGMIPALKAELGRRGLPVRPDVRAPLRPAAS